MQKFLSEVFADEVYVFNYVCNNPLATPGSNALSLFFEHVNQTHWTDSVAIHTYYRLAGQAGAIRSPEELKQGPQSDFKLLLLTIYENRPLPEADPTFNDRWDPLAGIDF
ncbi:hypothetical protein BV898_18792 [Hypsibius exemplaris]|uniref:Uncharacterized protein n=1 Tax=Hypsibius exemplaris TaxID=2072580 RepID=A0A9X6NKB0_HYPEX|nr:hypothetical protein BV898_18792 [Hypsibius exemplaris]